MAEYFNDNDVKIAPQDISKFLKASNPVADDNIDLYLSQRTNGNTQKAKRLGSFYVKELMDCVWTKAPADVLEVDFQLQLKLLFCYTVHRVVEDYSPNHIIANTAIGSFYEQLEDADKELFAQIGHNPAFSLYILLHRKEEETPEKIGEIFASLCNGETESECLTIGQSAYTRFLSLCANAMVETAFI